ncbi:MAG TPA: hypothetical protein VK815_13895 [Candidatus Acidoferrales bacterium]|jgi:hypothetical protein|nr:hypothetical protein [Candidatus Acidoferrales bacterium]
MANSRNQLSPPVFQCFFSLGAGAAAVWLLYRHQVWLLAATQAIWLLSLAFIHVRAKKNRGLFLEADAATYFGFCLPFYLMGLLLAACAGTIFA